jgi:hypothetical protein
VLQGKKHLLIVATENDSVFCYDADSGALYCQQSLVLPGETPADPLGCTDLEPENGITGTPVIDRQGQNGTIYVVSFTKSSGNYIYRLNALDLGTGNKTLGPTVINAAVAGNSPGTNGNGTVVFFAKPAKTADGPGACKRQHLYRLRFDLRFPTIHGLDAGLQPIRPDQVAAFNSNRNGIPNAGSAGSSGAGIWQAGVAPVIAPGLGSIIFSTGNGPFDPALGDCGDTVLRLGNNLNVVDSFTTANQILLYEETSI